MTYVVGPANEPQPEQQEQAESQGIIGRTLDVGNEVEGRHLRQLKLINDAMPTTANRKAYEDYQRTLEESLRTRAEKKGLWDPNELFTAIQNWFGQFIGK